MSLVISRKVSQQPLPPQENWMTKAENKRLIQIIHDFLPGESLFIFPSVCKKWREIIYSNYSENSQASNVDTKSTVIQKKMVHAFHTFLSYVPSYAPIFGPLKVWMGDKPLPSSQRKLSAAQFKHLEDLENDAWDPETVQLFKNHGISLVELPLYDRDKDSWINPPQYPCDQGKIYEYGPPIFRWKAVREPQLTPGVKRFLKGIGATVVEDKWCHGSPSKDFDYAISLSDKCRLVDFKRWEIPRLAPFLSNLSELEELLNGTNQKSVLCGKDKMTKGVDRMLTWPVERAFLFDQAGEIAEQNQNGKIGQSGKKESFESSSSSTNSNSGSTSAGIGTRTRRNKVSTSDPSSNNSQTDRSSRTKVKASNSSSSSSTASSFQEDPTPTKKQKTKSQNSSSSSSASSSQRGSNQAAGSRRSDSPVPMEIEDLRPSMKRKS